jgi:hypothetical protein
MLQLTWTAFTRMYPAGLARWQPSGRGAGTHHCDYAMAGLMVSGGFCASLKAPQHQA